MADSPKSSRRHRTPGRARRALPLALLAALAVASCSTGTGVLRSEAELREVMARRGVPASYVELPFVLDDDMRAWLAANVEPRQRMEERLEDLLHALLDPRRGGITYEAGFTGTAEQVFAARRANCLGFTNLFVAMARELGVPAYFLAVDEVEDFQRSEDEDLVVVSRHITAGYGSVHDLKVLEFTLGPEVDYHSVRRVHDLTAVALYYSNRGAELLQDGDYATARDRLQVAVAVDPELPLAWVNLGVARRRLGDLEGAEAAYREALEIEPRTVSAYQNLASLLRARGDETGAAAMLAVIPELNSRNPYSYLILGDEALNHGQLDDARRYYRRALRLYRTHAEPYAALGLWALARGDREAAREWWRRAQAIDADNPRVRRLGARLDASQGGGGGTRAAGGVI